jgi:hypothetical protein
VHRIRLAGLLGRLAERIDPAGAVWVAWPKKTSGVRSDLSEDRVRALALHEGLVDNKVCAVDEIWSALRCVYRRADRPRVVAARASRHAPGTPARSRRGTASGATGRPVVGTAAARRAGQRGTAAAGPGARAVPSRTGPASGAGSRQRAGASARPAAARRAAADEAGALADVRRELEAALATSAAARQAFGRLPPSHRREWLRHIAEASRPETRARRIASAVRRLGGP